MKLIHVSDLHIGKRVNEFSMIDDQADILRKIIEIVDATKPDGILIAGDVYDKSLPSIEGVTLFDEFLSQLHTRRVAVFLISGNHDSPERLNFGSRILEKNQIYIAGTFTGTMPKITMEDEYGELNVYLLPFVKPAVVNAFYPGIEGYEQAVATVLKASDIDTTKRNVLVAHQFVTSGSNLPQQCDSENISIGGLDQVDASVFDAFDYVALGHLHGPQRIGRDTIRYAGSPLKYSFSEATQKKSVTLVTLKEKGEVTYELLPLTPLHDMRVLQGPIEQLLAVENYSKGNTNDYIQAILTNEEEIYDAIGQIRSIYPNVMRIEFRNKKNESNNELTTNEEILEKAPLELFHEFFALQNNKEMTQEQDSLIQTMMEGLFEQ